MESTYSRCRIDAARSRSPTGSDATSLPIARSAALVSGASPTMRG
ncbi:MAG TPA: hypothetical protein VHJ77_09935 [Vicinamibacterales bacterium]|nr:hypothetical protein [Vicinamibacterales bacterium]